METFYVTKVSGIIFWLSKQIFSREAMAIFV